MRPHDQAPVLVAAPRAFPGVATIDAVALLAEPPARAPHWLARAYARVLAASTGPAQVGALAAAPDHAARLGEAGWLAVQDLDGVERARAAAWPALADLRDLAVGAGSPAPRLVLIGERAPAGGLPFYSRSGVWLLRALRELGWDELQVYLANAWDGRRANRDRLRALRDALARHDPTWVALGEEAAGVLRGAGVEHVAAPHPAWHRRFRFGGGPAGLAELLRAAGAPEGPWRGRALPVGAAPEDEGGADLPEALRLPGSVAYRPRARGASGGVAAAKAAKARAAYVAGAVPTVAAAARETGANATDLQALARREDWDAARAEHARGVAGEAARRCAAEQADWLAKGLRLAWGAALGSLASVVRRLQLPAGDTERLVPEPGDAARLMRLALDLTAAAPSAPAEAGPAEDLGDLARRIEATLAGGGAA